MVEEKFIMMENEIIKLTIKTTSGYGRVDQSYSTRIILTPHSISYRYMPYKAEDESYFTYKTNSKIFQEYYDQVCLVVVQNMIRDDLKDVCDAGMIQFVLTYQSKTKIKKEFFVPMDEFEGLMDLLIQMCPKVENIQF